ncbi:MAG TPA: anaerobic sulfite reductase subunit AsrA [Rectinemataceae bacterium]|nr:anaerobic sulfite reductase subunit AsrA [Rectinemataceae bacterium]
MAYRLSLSRMDELLEKMRESYTIYAPMRFEKRGRYSDTDLVRYDKIRSVRDIVYDEKSHFSPKEVIHPITQTLFHFTEFEYRESVVDERPVLVFVRPCDIHGIMRLDTMFLENGEAVDPYYERLRDKVKFVLMECGKGWDTCFCVSMGTNRTEDYSLAVRFAGEELLLEVKDPSFSPYFASEKEAEFRPEFVSANRLSVRVPEIKSRDVLEKVHTLPMWDSYDTRCLSCGACTAACISCSCFTTSDVAYSENGRSGDRRRVWASCLHKGFTEMAGGHGFRKTPGERMRFRTLHKVYDFRARFGGADMCVGCGRCTDRCPQLISFAATVNRLSGEVDRLNAEAAAATGVSV